MIRGGVPKRDAAFSWKELINSVLFLTNAGKTRRIFIVGRIILIRNL
jgi:hypothetical protein